MASLNLSEKGLPQIPQICAEVAFASQKQRKKQELLANHLSAFII